MTAACRLRLDGLEPDNLLAFLALLGLLRALDAADRRRGEDERLYPRANWDIDTPPLRPTVWLRRDCARKEIVDAAAAGIETLAQANDFDGQADLNYSQTSSRELLAQAAAAARFDARDRIDVVASLMTDAAVKDVKGDPIDPTPLCLLFGQGHQHFLDRLAEVPAQPAPPPRGRGKKALAISASDCLAEALFRPWRREDPTFSFRWDPEEDVRYALMAGDPTDAAYKPATQHGANRLAAIGLAALTLAPQTRAGRVRPAVIGGAYGGDGFSFAWPIWRPPATLSSVRAMLSHPSLREPAALAHLGVEDVMVARRISVGKFMNFSRARPLGLRETPHAAG
jgi:hypothetical protein